MGITLPDKLAVEHPAVIEVSVGKRAAVAIFVPTLGVDFIKDQPNVLPFDRVPGELLGFFAETGDSLFGMDSLRCVDADQAYFFVRADDDCVAVDDAYDSFDRTGRCAAVVKLPGSATDRRWFC